jgi:SAM-dependent methyltransferase
MADLNLETPAAETASCCSAEAQAACCEPSAKGECCGPAATAEGGCGCSAGQAEPAAGESDVRETVRQKYAEAARAAAADTATSSCRGTIELTDGDRDQVFGASLYEETDTEGATATAVAASLGCGVPTAVADLHEGETVLDLGSGAGADVLISARRVGESGRAIGLDMTDEMLELARTNAREAGVENVEFVKGYIEEIPLADESVDVIVSNCVVNLSGDKPRVFREAARVLKPGGRFAVSDVIASADMDDATRADMAAFTGCIAGALTEEQFRAGLTAAGLSEIEIRPTHPVHEFASSAIIRARKPIAPAAAARLELFEPAMCCSSGARSEPHPNDRGDR